MKQLRVAGLLPATDNGHKGPTFNEARRNRSDLLTGLNTSAELCGRGGHSGLPFSIPADVFGRVCSSPCPWLDWLCTGMPFE
jgi:hypothetical protein